MYLVYIYNILIHTRQPLVTFNSDMGNKKPSASKKAIKKASKKATPTLTIRKKVEYLARKVNRNFSDLYELHCDKSLPKEQREKITIAFNITGDLLNSVLHFAKNLNNPSLMDYSNQQI